MQDDAIHISGIVLAAGTSSRMGTSKLLLPFKGRPILAHVVSTALEANLDEVIVVIGHNAKQIMKQVAFQSAEVVVNPRFAAGQSSSIQQGLQSVSPRCDGALFLLGDQPLVTVDTIKRLCQIFQDPGAAIVIPCFEGQRGNPVLIHRSFFPQLRSLSGDRGARALFEPYRASVLKVDLPDPGILFDVDTPADYAHLKKIP